MSEGRFYVEDEFVIDRTDNSVKYDDMRGRVGEIVAELLNYVEALEKRNDQRLNWKSVEDEKPRPDSRVLCWDGHHFYTAYYAEFGEPGAKPGEGEFTFNGCHWATHWMYITPPVGTITIGSADNEAAAQ
jgi:hypothetical protein